MPRRLAVSAIGQTTNGIPLYIVKQAFGRGGYGVALYRLGSTRRTTDLPFAVAIIDLRRSEIREAGRYAQRYAPISGGADAVSKTVHWTGRQNAIAKFNRIAKEIGVKSR